MQITGWKYNAEIVRAVFLYDKGYRQSFRTVNLFYIQEMLARQMSGDFYKTNLNLI